MHAVIEALGGGPVDMFASSGGAVTALALVAAYPDDVATLVAHEPPLIPVLPDAAAAERARAGVRDAYEARGASAGMAAFVAMTSWPGEFTAAYFAAPAADPAAVRDVDPGRRVPRGSSAIRPVLGRQQLSPRRRGARCGANARRHCRGRGVAELVTGRTSVATAELLGQRATVFPSHHGGFHGGDSGYPGQPEAFARKLREILDDD